MTDVSIQAAAGRASGMIQPARRRSRALPLADTGNRRPWTRLGVAGIGAHVFYELATGVGMPMASRVGPVPAALGWSIGTVSAFAEAGRRPSDADRVFSVLNGVFGSAVIAHLTSWPATRTLGLPWLIECEGISGKLVHPYNVILYVSGMAAVGGLVENRQGRALGMLVPLLLVPALRREQRREFSRLRVRAIDRPGWWNRRLRARRTVLAEPH